MKYAGKLAVVTGLGIVESLHRQGAKVSILDWNDEAGHAVAGRLGSRRLSSDSTRTTGGTIFCQTDVTSWSSLYQAFETASAAFGNKVDYVFANAGITQMTDMRQTDPSHFATSSAGVENIRNCPPDLSVIDVNVMGVLYAVYMALAYFRQQDPDENGCRGRVIITGSTSSIYPCPNDALYGASGNAVLGLVRSLAPKIYQEGIYINALAPSIVRTNLGRKAFFDRLEGEGRVTPMKVLTDCVDSLLESGCTFQSGCTFTGQLAELKVDAWTFRPFPEYLNDLIKKNMDEFHPVDETEAVLAIRK